MFKPLLQKPKLQPHVDDDLVASWPGSTLCETEQAAEAQAAAAATDADEAATCCIALSAGCGGVDAADVLHCVHCVEVHPVVEAQLCPEAGAHITEPGASRRG